MVNEEISRFILREHKDKSETGRKYFQNTYLIKDLHPIYTKNSTFSNHLANKLAKDLNTSQRRYRWHISI